MPLWGQAQYVDRTSFDDVVYVLARSRGVGMDRVLWLRNRIWWGLNDRYRTKFDGSPLLDVPTWPVAAESAASKANWEWPRPKRMRSQWHGPTLDRHRSRY